jgi:hypothetical protein
MREAPSGTTSQSAKLSRISLPAPIHNFKQPISFSRRDFAPEV